MPATPRQRLRELTRIAREHDPLLQSLTEGARGNDQNIEIGNAITLRGN
jgi:hypothetical protein